MEHPPQEDEISDISDPEFEEQGEDDYDEILEQLKSQWLMTEITHSVSKTASEHFWRTALTYFSKLDTAPGKKKTSEFKTIRRHMYNNMIPAIDLEICYKNKATGEIQIVNDTITQTRRFGPDQYEKLYEIGTVQVGLVLLL